MTLKQKLGEVLSTGLGIAGLFVPALKLVQPLVGGLIAQSAPNQARDVVDGLTFDQQVLQIIARVQGMGKSANLTNDQKRQAAAVEIEQVILTSRAFMGHPIANEAKFKADVEKLAGNFADLVDDFKDDNVKVINP